MSRRTARKHVFNMVFQKEFHNDEEISEAFANYLEELKDEDENDRRFIEKEINGVLTNREIIDSEIKKHAAGWDLERLAKADIAILRLAVYELMFSEEIPHKVAVNEAVELAKEFSSDEAPAFINGILRSVVNGLGGQE